MKYYDSHCHVNIDPLLGSVSTISAECIKNNIYLNCVGIDLKTSKHAIDLSKKYSNIKAVIGIHPNDTSEENFDNLMFEIEQLYLNNKKYVVSIGETGLDYHYENFNVSVQKKYFVAHLELAAKYNLPVQIHIRNANEDAYEILKPYSNKLKIIIHCFSSSRTWAEKYSALGFYISIPGIITYESSSKLKKAITSIPLNQLLTETDAPWLAPISCSDLTNSPINIPIILKKIAEILQIDEKDLAKIIFNNSVNLFKINF